MGRKEDVIIFGAGAAGEKLYFKIRRRVNVICFVDNDQTKSDTLFHNKKVFSPTVLTTLEFDRIIIGSVYFQKIVEQLINEFNIPMEKIEVNPTPVKPKSMWWSKVLRFLTPAWILYYHRLGTDITFRRACRAAKYYENESLLDNYIMYESYNGMEFSCNPYAIFTFLLEREEYKHLKHVIAVKDTDQLKMSAFKGHPRVIIVRLGSNPYIRYAESCRYFFNNHSFQPYLIKKPGQIYITTWHSTVLRKLGADTEFIWGTKNISRAFIASDYFISPNKFTTENLFKAYYAENLMNCKISEIGYPRNDLTINADKTVVRKKLRITAGKEILLFAPPLRKQDTASQKNNAIKKHYHELNSNISKNYHVIIKISPELYPYLSHETLVYCAPRDVDINEIFAVTDLFVTDITGFSADFMLTNNPLVFFSPEKHDYAVAEKDLYFDIEHLPGPLCTSIEETIRCVAEIDKIRQDYEDLYARFKEKCIVLGDGLSCSRLADLVFKNHSDKGTIYDLKPKRPTILIYPGTLFGNGVTSSFLSVLNLIDYDSYNIVVLLPNSKLERLNQSRINKKAKVFYQPCADGFTLSEYIKVKKIYKRGFSKKDQIPVAVWQRNMRKIFSDLSFDTAIDFNGYLAKWAAAILFGVKSRRNIIFMHNDLNADRNLKNKGLFSVFSLYKYFDRIICVGEDSYKANIEGAGKYIEMVFNENIVGKMDFVDNPVIPDEIISKSKMIETVWRDGEKKIVFSQPINTVQNVFCPYELPFPEKNHVNFITIGRLSPEKNQALLLHAFQLVYKKHKNVKLYILGNGVLKKELTLLSENLGLRERVHFAGFISNPYPLLSLCDCFVLSSQYEGQPIVVLEALVLGRHVISTDIPGPRGLLRDRDGDLVEESIESLASAMIDWIEKGAVNKKRGKFDSEVYLLNALKRFENKVLKPNLPMNKESADEHT